MREGAALLQGLAICGHCGRALRVSYTGRKATPGYHCPGSTLVNGRSEYCLRVGGCKVDKAVAAAFLATLAPAGIEAALQAAEQLEADHDDAIAQWRREVERIQYQAQRAQRRYRAVDPDNRLVARGLEAEWEEALRQAETAQAELARREQARPCALSPEERDALLALGTDLERVWSAPSTTDRDRKELLHTLLEEVIIAVDKEHLRAQLTLRWRGGLFSDLQVSLRQVRQAAIRTDEDTVALVRRLATHYPDAMIAGILNRQKRTTATGMRFTANHVSSLRRSWGIPRFEAPEEPTDGDLLTAGQAAERLGVAPSTIHRWLNDGFIAGEQLTPGAPWRIRLTEELRSRFVEQPPEGYVTMHEAIRMLGVSRQTVLQRVKRGELETAYLRQGRRNGLRIKVVTTHPDLLDQPSSDRGAV